MSAPTCEKVTSIESGGGSSSNDQPAGEHEELAVVIQSDIGNEWLRSIMNEADESSSNTMPKHKIQKVPHMLRQMEHNEKYYNPEVISIGPYHRDKEVAQAGENTKLKSLDKFKTRFTREYVKSCEPPSITVLYDKVAEVASEARKCYAEGSTESINDRAFTQMMFLDGCFILQFIYYKCTEKKEEQSKMKMKINDIAFVQRDLFLLENQLPFKVLQALMSMNSNFAGDNKGLKLINEFISSTRASPREDSFREKVENFITKHITDRNRKQHPGSAESHSQGDEPAHLLELMHGQLINPNAFRNVTENKIVTQNKGGGSSCYLRLTTKLIEHLLSVFKKQGEISSWYSYRSVKDLETAGITFRPNKKNSSVTDVKYEPLFIRAILRLPPMNIDDSTKSLLLNLVAYEMCPDSPNDLGVASYIWFMDTLIDHAEDVKELRKKGILLNYLGSDEEVAGLFNEIAKNMVPNPHAYEDVKNQIESHYKNKVRLWMTEWLHTHFSTPWTFLTFLAAILAIALSFVQTYYAVNPK